MGSELKQSLCFMLEERQISQHCVVEVELLIQHQRIVTGGNEGELVIWEIGESLETIEAKVICYASLNHRAGRLKGLIVLNKPLQYYTDGVTVALFSVHEDGRGRLWDIYDGRCFQESARGVMNNVKGLVGLADEGRWVVVWGEDGLSIFDTWKMQVDRRILLEGLVMVKVDQSKKVIYVLDEQN